MLWNQWNKFKFIFVLGVFILLSGLSKNAHAVSLKGDGKIRIYAYHVDEYLEITYLDEKGHWIEEAYKKLNHLLRSRGDDLETQMSKPLIRLADHLQDHFGTDVVEVISGFRSPEFNAKLKSEGHNVATESFHMKSKAMDIHLDEIKESTIRDYLLKNHHGGVGYYGDRLMVHMDFGPKRKWHAGDFKENTNVGLLNKNEAERVTTDKFFYDLGDTQKWMMTSGVWKDAILELFHRGKWIDTGTKGSVQNLKDKKIILEFDKKPHLQSKRVFGKYRWVFKNGKTWQRSNEFYIKKQ